ncbi:MAG TPA: response regulator [Methylophilus sp.]|uniref:response regulator n=1 Tax=Methylophilus sp. TaxID=29541 RepID=UPI002BF6E601|nr:response regulator [Methylophilus sp.]HSH88084.1 response regulator [Methylophilus sp.]
MSTVKGGAAKFLIVDDSRAIQSIIKRVIESCNYPNLEIRSANDAEVAMEILEKYTPDLIITDWHMPKISGLEFCQHVCQTYGNRIPIGFITTESNMDKIESAYKSGAKFVINKPFQDVDLKTYLKKFVPFSSDESAADKVGEELASVMTLLSSMLKGQAFTLEPCPELKLADYSENNLIGLFGENGKTPPVNALAIMEMSAVGILWALNNDQPAMVPSFIKNGSASNDQLDEARKFMDEFGAGMSISKKNGPLKLARSSIVSRQFPRLEMSLKTNEGRADYKLNVPGVGTGYITYIKLI